MKNIIIVLLLGGVLLALAIMFLRQPSLEFPAYEVIALEVEDCIQRIPEFRFRNNTGVSVNFPKRPVASAIYIVSPEWKRFELEPLPSIGIVEYVTVPPHGSLYFYPTIAITEQQAQVIGERRLIAEFEFGGPSALLVELSTSYPSVACD